MDERTPPLCAAIRLLLLLILPAQLLAAELTRHLGLRAGAKIPLRIGAHDARWLRYEIHAR